MNKTILYAITLVFLCITAQSQQIIKPKWNTPDCGSGIAISYDGTKIFQTGEQEASLVDARTGIVKSTFNIEDLGESICCFSPLGDKIVAVNRYLGLIKLWDTHTGQLILNVYGGYSDPVIAIAFNKQGTRLVIYTGIFKAEVWDMQTGKRIMRFGGNGNEIVLMPKASYLNRLTRENINGDLLAIAKNNGIVELWDTDKCEFKRILSKTDVQNRENSVFNEEGTNVVLNSTSTSTVEVYSTESGELVYKDDGGYLEAAVFDRTGTKLILVREDIRIVNLVSRTVERVIKLNERLVYAEMNYKGDKIAVGTYSSISRDYGVYVWDIVSNTQVANLIKNYPSALSVRFIGEGDSLITNNEKSSINVWDIYKQKVLFLSEKSGRVSDIEVNNGNSRIITIAEGRMAILKPETRQKILASPGISALFNYKGDIVAARTPYTVLLYNENGDSLSQTERFPLEETKGIAFYNTKNKMAVVYNSGIMRVWDVNTFTLLNSYSLGVQADAIVFSPDDSKFAVAHGRGSVSVYNSETIQEICLLHDESITEVGDCFFSSTGKYIVSVGHQQGVWSTDNWKKIHSKPAYKFAINHEEDLIAGVTYDSVDVWNLNTGKHVATLKGHLDNIEGIHFDPNYNRLITYSNDQTTRLWNAVTGLQLAFLNTGKITTASAIFDRTSSKVITGNSIGVVSEFDISGITTSVDNEKTDNSELYRVIQRNNTITIELQETVNQDVNYAIYNMMGENILLGKMISGSSSTSFTIQNFVSGSYLLVIRDGSSTIVHKVVMIN